MPDYYPVIARAVAALGEGNSEAARRSLYGRARRILVAKLRESTPAADEAVVAKESAALEDAIRKIESGFAPPPPRPPGGRESSVSLKTHAQALRPQQTQSLTSSREAGAYFAAHLVRIAAIYGLSAAHILQSLYLWARHAGGAFAGLLLGFGLTVLWMSAALLLFLAARSLVGGAPATIVKSGNGAAIASTGPELAAYALAHLLGFATLDAVSAAGVSALHVSLRLAGQVGLSIALGVASSLVITVLMFVLFVFLRQAFTGDAKRAVAMPAAGPDRRDENKPSGFRDPTALTGALQFLLVALLLVSLAAMLSHMAQRELLQSGYSYAVAAANDARERIVSIVYLVTLAITIIVFGRWIYSANANARALGASGMEFSPGWSVGWYFIPVAAFWKPFQAMREIWKASKNPAHWGTESTDPILGWWWFGWITSNILGQIYFRLLMDARDRSSLAIATVFGIITEFFDLFAISLALILVTQLTRMQLARRAGG